jgi:hypothetical protein
MDQEVKCMICNEDDYGENNQIMICDYCQLSVH